jgi:hypothetical protein
MHPSDNEHEKDTGASMEMPRYVSHKRVWALEIAMADRVICKVAFVEPGYAAITLPADMWVRYQPVRGDFYVVYADGYKSFSPRKAFLEGYTRESVGSGGLQGTNKSGLQYNDAAEMRKEPNDPTAAELGSEVRRLGLDKSSGLY